MGRAVAGEPRIGPPGPRGRLGGRKLSLIGAERYRQFAAQLDRHRAAIFADSLMKPARKARLVTALDGLLKEVRLVIPAETEKRA